MTIKTLTPGQRIKLHSTYGQLTVTRGLIIKNGHEGTIVETVQGHEVRFDGIDRDVMVPKHWMEVV